MAKLSRDLNIGQLTTLHPRENLIGTGNLAAVNAEFFVDCDGGSTFSIDLRGTFNLTVEVSGTIDGTNFSAAIPVHPQNTPLFVTGITGSTAGIWRGECAGYRQLRVRCTAYTSGLAIATLLVSTAPRILETELLSNVTSLLVTATGAAAAAVTLTLPAPGAGLRQYVNFISISRVAAAVLTPAATPVVLTTTGLPGSLAFSLPADAAAQGTIFDKDIVFSRALAASAQNTAVTIVAPGTTGVIWRLTAGYYNYL